MGTFLYDKNDAGAAVPLTRVHRRGTLLLLHSQDLEGSGTNQVLPYTPTCILVLLKWSPGLETNGSHAYLRTPLILLLRRGTRDATFAQKSGIFHTVPRRGYQPETNPSTYSHDDYSTDISRSTSTSATNSAKIAESGIGERNRNRATEPAGSTRRVPSPPTRAMSSQGDNSGQLPHNDPKELSDTNPNSLLDPVYHPHQLGQPMVRNKLRRAVCYHHSLHLLPKFRSLQ